MKQLDNIDISLAKNLLSWLREYADMKKKLGLRGKTLFQNKLMWKKSFTVEYFSELSEDSAWEQAEGVFKKSFGETVKKDEVSFEKNEDLKWGMKVYVDDNMVDLSFKKVENLLQK